MRRQIHVALDPAKPLPLFAQLARSIADQIRSGRLTSGDVLPGSRSLARDLRIDRDTVLSAYGDLEAQGFITTIARTGTVVAEVPQGVSVQRGVARQVGFALDAGPPYL
ncbi:MAG: GntR family transcriptional regulator, partial [Kofleriaceae bacterium]